MDSKTIGLFGAVIAGGLVMGWILGGDSGPASGSTPVEEPSGSGPTASQARAIWPTAGDSPVNGPSGHSIEVPASNPDFSPSARAISMAETARVEAPERTPTIVAGQAHSLPPPARPTSAPLPVAVPRQNGGWGTQAGVPPSSGPMAPPAKAPAAQQPTN
jgi:hypothetical protein